MNHDEHAELRERMKPRGLADAGDVTASAALSDEPPPLSDVLRLEASHRRELARRDEAAAAALERLAELVAGYPVGTTLDEIGPLGWWAERLSDEEAAAIDDAVARFGLGHLFRKHAADDPDADIPF